MFPFVKLNFVILLNKMCCVNDDEFGWDWLRSMMIGSSCEWYSKYKSYIVDNLEPLGSGKTPSKFW